ncbi:TlpA family protein disulfide reductase [Mucilaginibacter corticis]|uniref:TlpA family protein disulfide reductase n=1 Tax=Mucilaginibacter corticis TaxID=2597670 RepID=A0A556MS27_9SPHI|nr:TlpA disulfide reductase family protein [Mucilaginibacter corticis]TSJ42764.1 TlpA family protein disulfide reductase [Mucilaginibacter corticis]
MKNLAIGLICCIAQTICYAQTANQPKKMFADTEPLVKQYLIDCNKAWDAKDEKRAQTYYDSINRCITNSYLGNHQFKDLKGKTISLGKMKKPVLITVSASWCAPCRAEIPALNKITKAYKDKIDFIVLFWNTREETEKLAALYDNAIYIVPSITQVPDDIHEINIGGFKHFRGYPTNYMVTTNKQIVKYDEEGAAVAVNYVGPDGKSITVTEEQAFNMNYKKLKDDVDFLISHNDQ